MLPSCHVCACIMKYIDLVLYKSYVELRRDIVETYFGFLWWIIEPLLYMVAFYLVFSTGLRAGGNNYISFLLCGLVPWKWFASTVNQSCMSLVSNRGLIQQVYLPKIIFPFIPAAVNFLKFLFMAMILIIFLWIMGFSPHWNWLLLIPVICLQFCLTLGIGLMVAALVPFFMDLRVLVTNGLTMLMFLSGIFYDVSTFPEDIKNYFYFNPMVIIIETYRNILLHAELPSLHSFGLVALESFTLILAASVILIKLDKKYPKVLL